MLSAFFFIFFSFFSFFPFFLFLLLLLSLSPLKQNSEIYIGFEKSSMSFGFLDNFGGNTDRTTQDHGRLAIMERERSGSKAHRKPDSILILAFDG